MNYNFAKIEFQNQEESNVFETKVGKKNKRSSSVYQNPIKVEVKKNEEINDISGKDSKPDVSKDSIPQNDKIQIKSKIRSRQGTSRVGLKSQRSKNADNNQVLLSFLIN